MYNVSFSEYYLISIIIDNVLVICVLVFGGINLWYIKDNNFILILMILCIKKIYVNLYL